MSSITHAKVLHQPNSNDPNIVSPSDWNAAHIISDGSINGVKIAPGTITNIQIAGNTILNSNIANSTIADAKLANPKPYLSVYANGSTDGTQINNAYATNPYIELAAGTFVIDTDIIPPAHSEMRIAPGVSFTWSTFKINIINSAVTITRNTIQGIGSGVTDTIINQLNIDSTNGAVEQIILSGLTIVTYNQIIVSPMGNILTENCLVRTLVQTNSSGLQYPTQNNFVTCNFSNSAPSSTVITLGATFGQIWFHDCEFLFQANNQTMIGFSPVASLSTAIFISNAQIITSTSSLSGMVFFSIVQVAAQTLVGCTFNFSNFYVEQTTTNPLIIFQLDTHTSTTSEFWGSMENFNFIDPGPVTVVSINSSQTLQNGSQINFVNFNSHGVALSQGTIPAAVSPNFFFFNVQAIPGTVGWIELASTKTFITVTPNGGPAGDGGDYGPNTVGTSTLGFQEAINAIGAQGGTIWVMPNSSKYDLGINGLIIPNDRSITIKAGSIGYPANNASQAPTGVMIRYGGTDWAIKTNGSQISAFNNYFNLENIVLELYGGNYLGGCNFLNLVGQFKGTCEIVDFSANGSTRVAGSIGVTWDYSAGALGTGTGGNGYEILNDNLFVKGFDGCVVVNVDHWQIQKMHLLFGHTYQLAIGTASYYPLNPTFGDIHFVAGTSNTVADMLLALCTASDSVETWISNIYIEAVGGGAYSNHFNIKAPLRPNRGFTIGMLHASTVTTANNYQHILVLSRDGMANGQFAFGYSSPAVPGTGSFTNTNYYTVTIYQTGTLGGTLTITDVKGNAMPVGTPAVFQLKPGESGQFASSGPSTWSWYAETSG